MLQLFLMTHLVNIDLGRNNCLVHYLLALGLLLLRFVAVVK